VAVALFGSAARGEATDASDMDLFAIAEGLPARHFKRCTLLNGLAERTSSPHSPDHSPSRTQAGEARR